MPTYMFYADDDASLSLELPGDEDAITLSTDPDFVAQSEGRTVLSIYRESPQPAAGFCQIWPVTASEPATNIICLAKRRAGGGR